MNEEMKNVYELKVGFVSSLLLSIFTIVGFGCAMIAIPPSGPYWDLLNCLTLCFR